MGSKATTPTIYFGYGSNLWLHQMSLRCPTSKYLGIARLNGFRWIINDRGYANVVEIAENESTTKANPESKNDTYYDKVVYGMVYSLQPTDESRLDKNEGVPIAYTKEYLTTDFWESEGTEWVDVSKEPDKRVDMLVYIDRKRTETDVPRKEYVYRMNRGIEDAERLGVPGGYVKTVMRAFIPGDDRKEGDEHEEKALGQAKGFRDESGVF